MATIDKKDLFENTKISKAVAILAIPTIISQVITIIYNWADTFFIGQLNNTFQIAAINICHPIFMMTTALANLFGIGGASVISRAMGASNMNKVKKVATLSALGAVITSIIYSIIILIVQTPLLNLLGASTNTFTYAKDYLFWVVVIGTLPTVLNSTLAHLIRSTGLAKQASFGIMLGGILNIILDPIFIFAFKMEVTGAAIATCIANILATLYFVYYLYKTRKSTILSFSPANLKGKNKTIFEIISSGISGFCLTLMAIFSNICINKLMAGYADEAISGVSIAKKIDLCVIAFAQGLTQGVLPLIGYNFASNNFKRMKGTIYFSGLCVLIFSITCTLTFSLFPKFLVSLFIKDELTLKYGSDFLRILCLTMPMTSLVFLANTTFQATRETGKALTIILLRKGIIDIPLMLLLNHYIGLYGIILSQPIIDCFSMIIVITLYLSFNKKLNKLITIKENTKVICN